MPDEAGDPLDHHEDGVEADRNGKGLAMADTMMVMPVAMTMAVVMMAMGVPVPVAMSMVMIVIMVTIMVIMPVSGGVGMGIVGVIMSHKGSFRVCCVAQMSHCSRIRARQDRWSGAVWASWWLVRVRCLRQRK
jgi:hypothetical protein